MRTLKLPFIEFQSEENSDILVAELTRSIKIDLARANEIVSSRVAFMEHMNHFMVADVSKAIHMTAEAKDFFQKPEGGLKNLLGAAFIASNPVSALIANIFIKTPKDFQAKFFSDRQAAIQWIKDYKQKRFVR
jgi:hypothetical protein